MTKEKRYINEIRSVEGGDSRHIEGYALLFNVRSVQLGDFSEVIMPSALTDEILKRSDILALLNHDITRGVLARSRNGEGSLSLSIDEKGLRYEFDAPRTSLGDELLEGIRRGDISNSSFSFLVKRDEWQQTPEGGYLRIIHEFDQLFDISPVYQPAYDETTVDCRGLEQLKKQIESRMTKEDEKPAEEPKAEEPKAEESKSEESKSEETKSEETEDENRADEEPAEEPECKEEGEPADQSKEDEPKEEDKEENRNIAMAKFSLIKAIRSVVNGEPLDATAAKVTAEGRSIMSASNQAVNGQIVIPVESRAEGDTPVTPSTPNGIMATVATAGQENVAEDKLDIVGPLRNKSALGIAGATILTGLVGDVSIPVYSGSNVCWKGECVTADNGQGEFTEVNLKPRRLTAFLDISKQFVYQDSNSAEELLRTDLINALAEKLEQTIFGDEAGTAFKPAGLFNGVTADSAAVKYGDIVDWEAELENANVGEIKYIVNPSAKAILRKTAKDSGSGLFVMADGEIEGNQVISTASVVKKGVILGDFRDLVVGQWGALDIVVDPYTKAADGQIRVVVNAYFDAALRRPTSVVKHILK